MIAKPPALLLDRIEAVRRFNRFYERRIRDANRSSSVNELTPEELRVFHVLGEAGDGAAAAWLNSRLKIDPAYLSRILQKFRAYEFVSVRVMERDRRHREFALTEWGRSVLRTIDEFHSVQVISILEGLPQRQQRRLVHAMKVIEQVLTRDPLENLLESIRAMEP